MKLGTFDMQTVVLFIVGGLLMYGTFSWTAGYLKDAKQTSEEQREKITRCSELQVDYIERDISNGTTTVYFTVNRPLQALKVSFKGSDNSSTLLRDVQKNTIYSASTEISDVNRIETTAQECSRLPN